LHLHDGARKIEGVVKSIVQSSAADIIIGR
jgi:hypothetical protein